MRQLAPGAELRVLHNGRLRHAIVTAVASQTSVTVRIGRGATKASKSVTRAARSGKVRPFVWS